MPTPTLQGLATGPGGAILNNAYVNKQCGPSRSSFLTGFYPHSIGVQDGNFKPMEPKGVPLEFVFLPDKLSESGYKNYMVGKWHLGYCNVEYTPLRRGFDKFYGYYGGSENYFTHKHITQMPIPEGASRKDYVYLDLWDNEQPDFTRNNQYSSVSDAYLDHCTHYTDENRKIYCGMVKAMDTAIGQVVQKLRDLDLYNDTVIIFSTDNGGDFVSGANNYPHRGNKGTLWEGGTRAISFIHAPKFLQVDGTRDSLFHIVDWYPTILSCAGADMATYLGDGSSNGPTKEPLAISIFKVIDELSTLFRHF